MAGPSQNLLQFAMKAHRAGDFATAERLYSKLLRQAPGDFNSLHLLGVIRAQQQRFAEADRLIAKALEIHCTAEALNNHGSVLVELGRQEEAIARLRRALSMKPDYADAYFNLGNALNKCGKLEEAAKSFTDAVKFRPDHLDAHKNLCKCLHVLKRDAEAISALRRAIEISPRDPGLSFNLAILLQDAGDLEESRQLFEHTIACEPQFVGAHYYLAQIGKVRSGDKVLVAAEALAQRAGTLKPKERSILNFALGKAYEDVGRYDESFLAFVEGNRRRRPMVDFDEEEMRQRFHGLKKTFTAGLLAEKAELGNDSNLPIFIVGFPRSGTTLTEQILASHPQVHGAGELDFVGELTSGAIVNRQATIVFPESLAHFSPEGLRGLGTAYVERLRRLAPWASHITDKMPQNFMLLGFIRLILPRAKIIHVKRDPIDTCLSCFSLNFAETNLAFTYDLGELGRHYRRYLDLMDHWRLVMPESSMLEVQYEDLIENFEAGARRIVDYCGLPWDDRCLEFHQTERTVRTASVSQVRQPIYRSSVQRWRRYEKHLGPLLEALGMADDKVADGTDATGLPLAAGNAGPSPART